MAEKSIESRLKGVMNRLAFVLLILLNLWIWIGAVMLGFPQNPIVAGAIILAVEFLVICVHEAGHALAVKRIGGLLVVIGIMFVEYDLVHRRFGWMRKLRGRDVGGFVLWAGGEQPLTRGDRALVAAAGPSANFLLAAAAALAVSSIEMPTVPHEKSLRPDLVLLSADSQQPGVSTAERAGRLPDQAVLAQIAAREDRERFAAEMFLLLSGIVKVFALLSIGLGLINLLPFDGSDGQQIWRALKGRAG